MQIEKRVEMKMRMLPSVTAEQFAAIVHSEIVEKISEEEWNSRGAELPVDFIIARGGAIDMQWLGKEVGGMLQRKYGYVLEVEEEEEGGEMRFWVQPLLRWLTLLGWKMLTMAETEKEIWKEIEPKLQKHMPLLNEVWELAQGVRERAEREGVDVKPMWLIAANEICRDAGMPTGLRGEAHQILEKAIKEAQNKGAESKTS